MVLRLAGFSDQVILAVARRRSQGLPVLSGEKLGDLKNSGASEAAILDFIEKGIGEEQANAYIKQREYAAGGHGFVYQGHTPQKKLTTFHRIRFCGKRPCSVFLCVNENK